MGMQGEEYTDITPPEWDAIRYYVKGKDKTQAWIDAHPDSKAKRTTMYTAAYQFFNRPVVKRALSKIQAKGLKNIEVDKTYVLGVIKETIDRCRQATPVLDKMGEPVLVKTADGTLAPAYTFDATAVLKGADMLMKHNGLYELDNMQKNDLEDAMRSLPVEMKLALLERLKAMRDEKRVIDITPEAEAEVSQETKQEPKTKSQPKPKPKLKPKPKPKPKPKDGPKRKPPQISLD